MLEGQYTSDVTIEDGVVIVKLKAFQERDDSYGYHMGLEEIDSVSDDVLPLDWEAGAYSSAENFGKGLAFGSGESPVLRALVFTTGFFVSRKTHNPAFLIYKHRDRCVTITLKEARVLTTDKRAALQKITNLSVKEFSFEVDDKAAVKSQILDALGQNQRDRAP